MPSKQPEALTDQDITDVIKEKKPKTVEELVELIQQKYPVSEQKILEHILRLKDQGKMVLTQNSPPLPPLLISYLFSAKANWYWTIIVLALATTALVFVVPENAYPIVYTRYVLGSIFVLFLPGYSFIKALFPTKELDNIERVALSIGMSLALVAITGLLLNYTPWGIRTTPVTLSLLALTTVFATAALIREHGSQIEGKTLIQIS